MFSWRFCLTTSLLLLLTSSTAALSSMADPSAARRGGPKADFRGGAGVGRLVVDDRDVMSCHYDMVLVERIQGKPRKESGLFVPQDELPRLHLCRVVSLGPGEEQENGLLTPMPDIAVGDIVIAKNPWGIGPKDEETTDGKKLSFMRSQDIAAVIRGGLAEDGGDSSE